MTTPWTPVPILMYHAVEDQPRPPMYKHFYVLASEFAAQMRWLKAAGYQAITFQQLQDALQGKTPLVKKPILLTFDDGYMNLLTNVHPLLRELEFPYTVFLISEKIGTTNDWVAAEGYEPTPLLNWREIRRMQADGGVQFHPHTASHPHLAELTPDQIRKELIPSREYLQQELQTEMDVLCYPYGNLSDAVVNIAREAGYAMAVTTEFGRVRAGDDPLRLPRISVYHVPPFSLSYGIGSLNFRWRLKTRRDERPEESETPCSPHPNIS